jgi:hypothetical protein
VYIPHLSGAFSRRALHNKRSTKNNNQNTVSLITYKMFVAGKNMNNIIKLPLVLSLASLIQGCIITEPVSHTEIKATENSAFTSDGRLFVVGENTDSESWIFEISQAADGSYQALEYIRGTLDGTQDGHLSSATSGEDCRFAGLTASDNILYAACVREGGLLNLGTEAISLFQVNTQADNELIKTGRMSDSNFLQKDDEKAFNPNWFMANGMAVDSNGYLYITNSKASLASNRDAISQVTITDSGNSSFLDFNHQTWLSGNEFFPNGVQIEDNTLYYAGGSDIHKVRINEDASAGEKRRHYDGADLAVIDDFAINEGYIAYAKVSAPGAVIILKPAGFEQTAKYHSTVPMSVIPSSIVYQQDTPAGASLFTPGSLLVTSFFSGGLYQIEF